MSTEQTSHNILAGFLSLLVAFTAVLGVNVNKTGDLWGNVPASGVATILRTLLIAGAIYLCAFRLLPALRQSSRPLLPDSKFWDPKVLFFFVVIVDTALALLYYPCTQNWDTYTQINDFMDGTTVITYTEGNNYEVLSSLNDHHPIFTTILYGSFAKLGQLSGHEKLGSFLFIELQILMYASAFVFAVQYLESIHKGTGKYAGFFFMFYPLITFYTITMVKDSTFGVLFLLYMVLYLKLYNGDRSRSTLIWFVVLSVIMPLTKKTAVYILSVSNIPLVVRSIKQKDSWKRITANVSSIVLPCFIMFFLLPSVVFPAFNVFPGGKQEVYGTLFQQTARVKVYYPNAYTEEEADIIRKVIDYDNLETIYKQHITDPVKKTYKLATVTDEDMQAYLSLWARKAVHYPKAYVESVIGTAYGYLAPGGWEYLYFENHTYPYSETGKRASLRAMIPSTHYWFEDLPGINLFFQMALFTWWVPVLAFFEIVRRRGWKEVFKMLPVFMTQLTLLVSPLSYARYALPLVLITPLYFTLFTKEDSHG